MMTRTHRLLGVTSVLAMSVAGAHLSLPALSVAALSAAVSSGGDTSPDVDNQRWFKTTLGHINLLRHRVLLHWLGLPAGAALVWWWLAPVVPGWVFAVPVGLLIGWCSHLFPGDFVFGKGNRRYGLGRGIPLLPWGCYVGLGIRCGGVVERVTSWGLVAAIVVLTVQSVLG